jgi:hypothetical protein
MPRIAVRSFYYRRRSRPAKLGVSIAHGARCTPKSRGADRFKIKFARYGEEQWMIHVLEVGVSSSNGRVS